MSNTTLNLTSQINSSVLTSKEKIELNTTMVGFKVNRWNFTIDGFDFTTSHNLSANNYIWIKPNLSADKHYYTTKHGCVNWRQHYDLLWPNDTLCN